MARRRRGDGSAYYDTDAKSYVAVVSLGTVNGKRVRKKVRAPTKVLAERERDRLLRAYRRGGDPATETLDRYLGHAFDDPERGIEASGWLLEHGRSIRRSTLVSYDGHVQNHIKPLLGGMRMADIKPRDVRRLIATLERKGLKPATIHLVIRTLSVALGAAVHDRSIEDNACEGVRLPRIDREPVRPLTADEADQILDAVKGTWLDRPVRVLLGSGLRRGEVLGLDQGDVQPGFVRVRVSKTVVRSVPISADAEAALREAIADAPVLGPREPVFWAIRRHDGVRTRLSGSGLTHALPRLLADAGLGHLTPHALRHGAATLMLADGHPMRVIAEQLGHKNPALTARVYAHVVPEAQRSAVASLERRKAR